MRLTFLGGAGTVTGSRTLVEHDGGKLLVDCGLFQGLKELRIRDRQPLDLHPGDIDAIVLTHAHLDHSGAVPLFVKQGYRAPVYGSSGTVALCGILWRDAAWIQTEDAERANRKGYSKHHPALPLFDLDDVERAVTHLRTVDNHDTREIHGAKVTWRKAGHILGANSVLVETDRQRVLFSGDVGRPNDPIHGAPEPLPDHLDLLVLESTYGDRSHGAQDPEEEIATVVRKTVKRGGRVIVPAFAVGRVQRILWHLARLKAEHRIPDVPVWLNSPLGEAALHAFRSHPEGHGLSEAEVDALCAVVRIAHTRDESVKLNKTDSPCIVLAGSGMATGGRVLHHLTAWGPDPRSTILLSGFQAAGTRGDRLLRGERELKIFGQWIPIHAQVVSLDTLSAHADADELVDWIRTARHAPRRIVLNHGETNGSNTLAKRIEAELDIPCGVASDKMKLDV